MSDKLNKLIYEEFDKLIDIIPDNSDIDCIFICTKWGLYLSAKSYKGYSIFFNSMVKEGVIYGVEYKKYKEMFIK